MDYYLIGHCAVCEGRVWVNLDGSCVSGHPDSAVSSLEVYRPEALSVDALMSLMLADEDKRWVEGTNLVKTGQPEQAYQYLAALEPTMTNPVGLHFVYNGLIEATYRLRDKHPNWLGWCIEYCRRDIVLFPRFRSRWIADERLGSLFNLATSMSIGGRRDAAEATQRITRPAKFDLLIPSFKQLSIIYEKEGRFAEALEVARQAQAYGLRDGTKGGYEGRIARLQKKLDMS